MKKLGTIFLTLIVSTLLVGVFVPMINKGTGGKLEDSFDKWLGVNQNENPGTQNEEKSLYEKRHADDIVYTLDATEAMKEGFYTYNMGSNISQISRIASNSGVSISCRTKDSDGTVLQYITGGNGSADINVLGDAVSQRRFLYLTKYNKTPKTLIFDVDTSYISSDSFNCIRYISFEIMFYYKSFNYTTDEVFRASLLNMNNSENTTLFIGKKEDLSGEKDKQVRFNSLINVSDYTNVDEKNLAFSIDIQQNQWVAFDYIRWTFSEYPFNEVDFNKHMEKFNHGEINYYDVNLASIHEGAFSYDTDSSFFILDKDSTLTFAFRDPENKITLEEKEILGSFGTCVGKKKRANNWTYFQFKFVNFPCCYIDADSYNLGTDYVSEMDIVTDVMIYPSGTIPSDEHYAKLNPVATA